MYQFRQTNVSDCSQCWRHSEKLKKKGEATILRSGQGWTLLDRTTEGIVVKSSVVPK